MALPSLDSFAGTQNQLPTQSMGSSGGSSMPSLDSFLNQSVPAGQLGTLPKPAVSMSGLNSSQVVPSFDINPDTFDKTDTIHGIFATLGNAALAPAKAAEQAIRLPGQAAQLFQQNGFMGGMKALGGAVNDTVIKPTLGTLNTIGNTAGGVVNAGIRAATGDQNFAKNTPLGQQGDEALKNAPQNAMDALKGAAKFGIEQPTNAALALEGAGQQLGGPKTDLIHDIGGGTIDAVKPIIQPTIDAVVGKASEMGNNLANSLEKESLRLTPTQKAKLGTRLNDITQFNIDNNITGNPGARLSKINDVVQNYNTTMDNYLKNEVPDNVVQTSTLEDRLNNLKIKYQASDVADLEGAGKQIDSAVNRLKVYGDNIPTARLDNLKSSYYDQSYGNQIGSGITDEVQADIARVYKEAIQENLPGKVINGQSIADFNKDYGNALTSRKILQAAIGKPQIGPIGRIGAKVAGAALGSPFGVGGEVIGGLYGDKAASMLMGTNARSIIAHVLGDSSGDYLPDTQSTQATMTNMNTTMSDSVPPVGMSVKNVGITPEAVALRKPVLTSMANQIDDVINNLKEPSSDLNTAINTDNSKTIDILKSYQQMSEKQWQQLPPEQFTELVNTMKDAGAKIEGLSSKITQPRTPKGLYSFKKK